MTHMFPMETNPGQSWASGWSAYQTPDGRWQWSAYGPRGGSLGSAASKADAERAAQREADNLKGPHTTWA